MVKLTEVEDEHYAEKRAATKDDELLLASDDDDDYTDTGTSIIPCLPAQKENISEAHPSSHPHLLQHKC